MDLLNWIAPATLTGCPATVAPAGPARDGLPVGIQIMGVLGEDATPITFADPLSREVEDLWRRRDMGYEGNVWG